MSYLHLTRTRTRDRSPSPSFLSRPLIRRDTKRSRDISLSDDDEHDDYPYSLSHRPVRPSRALTLRDQPSQLERYNIWSDRHKSEDRDDDKMWERERELERIRTYRHSHGHHHHHHHHHHRDDHVDDDEEKLFRLKVQATFSKPAHDHHHHHHHSHHDSSSHHHHSHHHLQPISTLLRKDKYVDENWETRERSRSRSRSRSRGTEFRRDSFWGDGGFWGDERVEKEQQRDSDEEKDVWRRYRKVKRTKTEEWRPLVGWRRV